MPRYIVKLHDNKLNKDFYMEWSTVVDAPITSGGSLEEFKAYYMEEYGRKGMSELEDRLKRVEEKGISSHAPFDDLSSLLKHNRAGDNETSLDKEGILDKYCRFVAAG